MEGEMCCLRLRCRAGDAYTYTLQPVFHSLGRQFLCHVRRRRPQTLYQLWFYVTVPGTGFETPRVHRQVGFFRRLRRHNNNNNNNNNNQDNVYGAVITTNVIVRVYPVHVMNAD